MVNIDGRPERRAPHLSRLNGYLVVIRPVRFEIVPSPFADRGGPERVERLTCDLVVIDAPEFGPRIMAVGIGRRGDDSPANMVVIPHTFPGMFIAAAGIVAHVKALDPAPSWGRLYRYERLDNPGRKMWALRQSERDWPWVQQHLG